MAGVAAGLLQARRCIRGVAEERDLHLDGAEFANDHGRHANQGVFGALARRLCLIDPHA
jgi:hypothetical protein